MPVPDLGRPRWAHIVGIGGGNMNTIASVLLAMGHRVSGSDQRSSPVLQRLQREGAAIFVGHDPANLGAADAVTFSAAVADDNVELAEARRRGTPVFTRAEMLAAICGERRTVAVSGTHGKTTTTAMLAGILVESGSRPSYMVGGELAGGGSGARWDAGPWLVVEADESDGTFLALPAEGVVVTNIEADHVDHYGSFGALEDAFRSFVVGAPGPKVVCADDPVAASLSHDVTPAANLVTYGTSPEAGLHLSEVELGPGSSSFLARGERYSVGVPGMHNVLNAGGALAMALCVGATESAARTALANYRNVARRFQTKGQRDGVTYIDDYAHNPGKVKAAVATARLGGWGRVVVVFQPHRYSRTAALWSEFGAAFQGADLLLVTSVYSAGEAPVPGIGGELIAGSARAACPGLEVVYVEGRADLAASLRQLLRPGDLCLTMGAGDITTLSEELLATPGQGGGRPRRQ